MDHLQMSETHLARHAAWERYASANCPAANPRVIGSHAASEKTLSYRPFPHRTGSVRYRTDREANLHRRIFRPPPQQQAGRGDGGEELQISVRDQQPLDHRRIESQEHWTLR